VQLYLGPTLTIRGNLSSRNLDLLKSTKSCFHIKWYLQIPGIRTWEMHFSTFTTLSLSFLLSAVLRFELRASHLPLARQTLYQLKSFLL
jgi:hypothetical protein